MRRRPGRRRPGRRQDGHVLIVALIVVIVAMSAALLVAANFTSRNALLRDERRDVRMNAFVDAGLARALALLYGNPSAFSSSEEFGTEPDVAQIEYRAVRLQGSTYEVTVKVGYAGLRRGARARVWVDPSWDDPRPPRVLEWEAVGMTEFEDIPNLEE